MGFQDNPIKKYRCTCGAEVDIDLREDDRAIYNETECESCGGLMKRYFVKGNIKGNIDEVEGNNPVIQA